jgi:hypothetical protein
VLLALLLVQSAAPAAHSAPAASGLEPHLVEVGRVRAAFPDSWRLPRKDRAGNALPGARFEDRLIRLASEPLAPADAASGRPALMLGDLLARAAAAARAGSVELAREQIENLLEESRAPVPAAHWSDVSELLDIRDFVSPKWDPDDEDERDGFLIGDPWTLPEDCWPAHDGERDVVMGALFMAADIAVIKNCESDFSRYFHYPGNRYEAVAPVSGTYLAHCEDGNPSACGLPCALMTSISVDFASDLPFPFGTYALRLRMLTDLDEVGRPVTWIYTDSEDFHWLAGYDLFEPIHNSQGDFVGTLVIRQFGADIDGVPDRCSHREAGFRTVLGGLRRNAEALYASRADPTQFPERGAVPVTPVRAAGD